MAVSLDRTPGIMALRQHYRFSDDANVIASLRRHPELVPLLHEAATRVPQFFPQDTTLRLEVLEDPDGAEDEEPTLYAVIETSLPLAEARSRLYTFDDAWWLEAFRDANGWVALVVE